jgi:hypothetical protein
MGPLKVNVQTIEDKAMQKFHRKELAVSIFAKAPFLIVGVSLFLPLIAAFFDNKLYVYLPIIVTAIICIFAFKGRASISKVKLLFCASIALLFSALISWIYSGGAHLGLANVLLQTLMYLLLIRKYGEALDPRLVVKYFMVLYSIVLLYIGFEWILIISGNQSWLVNAFNAESVVKYKNYNSAVFINYIYGDLLFTGANGPTLGSQGASQLILAGLVFVTPWSIFRRKLRSRDVILSFIFGFFFLVNATMTASLTLALIFFYMILLKKDFVLSGSGTKLVMAGLLLIFFEFVITIVFYRIDEIKDINNYTDAFLRLSEFESLNTFQLLFGAGSHPDQRYSGSDFGWAGIVFSGGIISYIAFNFVAVFLVLQVRKCVTLALRKKKIMTESEYLWAYLASANLLTSFVFYFGLIHYTPSIELGGAQLFALSMAVGFYASNQVLRNLNSKNIVSRKAMNGKPVLA